MLNEHGSAVLRKALRETLLVARALQSTEDI